MQKLINVVLNAIKWPLAVSMLFLILPAFRADVLILQSGLTRTVLFQVFLPMLVVIVAWFSIPGLRFSFLSVFEHEFTHMIFAILSFNHPKKIEFKPDGGGSFSYTGRSNWLISLAPYFFPTFPIIVMLGGLIYIWLAEPVPLLYWNVFGTMLGYHIASILGEIHPEQTDFKKAGWLFTCSFLPGINLIVFGVLVSFACHGYSGISEYWGHLMHETAHFVQFFIQNFLHL